MDVNCMTLKEIGDLVGKEVYVVRNFYIRKDSIHWVLWFEHNVVLGFYKNDPLHRDNCKIDHAYLTKESLLKGLPKYVCDQRKQFEEEYEETIREAKETLMSNLKWLERSEQSFLKQLEDL